MQTIKEFIISKILDSYTKMKQFNIIQDNWPQLSQEYFDKVLAGRFNLKLFAYRNKIFEQTNKLEDFEEKFREVYN